MIDLLTGFVAGLRAAGLPVSLTESVDATEALRHVPLERREALRLALSATLVKDAAHRPIFDSTFDLYFSPAPEPRAPMLGGEADAEAPPGAVGRPGARHATSEAEMSASELAAMLEAALRSGDPETLALLARLAVARFAGLEPGRPVGVAYYRHRTLRSLELDSTLAALVEAVRAPGAGDGERPADELEARLLGEELAERAEVLRRLVEAEIRRQLVAERGAEAVAKGLRAPLTEDVDFMHASREELAAMERLVYPLARTLATRLARRRRHRRRGPLDVKATIRHSLGYGGVPLEPRFRSPHPAKPEIVVFADVSGSVSSFARFTLHLVYAIAGQFSKVRSFAFVDAVDEITAIFKDSSNIAEAVGRVAREADVVGLDGHSDYGRALTGLLERYGDAVGPRTSLIVLGDARSNYHPAAAWALAELARRARRTYWLNPEPRAYWGSGDSVIGEYAPMCDSVHECRNLRQLEAFVASIA